MQLLTQFANLCPRARCQSIRHIVHVAGPYLSKPFKERLRVDLYYSEKEEKKMSTDVNVIYLAFVLSNIMCSWFVQKPLKEMTRKMTTSNGK